MYKISYSENLLEPLVSEASDLTFGLNPLCMVTMVTVMVGVRLYKWGSLYWPSLVDYSLTCLKWPLKNRQNKGLKDRW